MKDSVTRRSLSKVLQNVNRKLLVHIPTTYLMYNFKPKLSNISCFVFGTVAALLTVNQTIDQVLQL